MTKIITAYRPTIIEITFADIQKLLKKKFFAIKNHFKSVTILFKIHTYYNKIEINKLNESNELIRVKYLYVQIDDILNEYGNLDIIINNILTYFNTDTIINRM